MPRRPQIRRTRGARSEVLPAVVPPVVRVRKGPPAVYEIAGAVVRLGDVARAEALTPAEAEQMEAQLLAVGWWWIDGDRCVRRRIADG